MPATVYQNTIASKTLIAKRRPKQLEKADSTEKKKIEITKNSNRTELPLNQSSSIENDLKL